MQKVRTQKLHGKKPGRIMPLSKYAFCENRKSRFVKEQEASVLFSSLRIKTPLSGIR